jgi:two-component system CheB/CheR fusion protein
MGENEGRGEQQALDEILALLLEAFRIDFSHYRQTTVRRRISRRAALSKSDGLAAYRGYLDQDPDEINRLYDDLLLSFTEFFRDPPVFDLLKREAFPRLVEHRSPRTPIRIWVPGCATGEEVYSLAICLHEFLEESRSNATVQFFGTDLVPRHIERARAGVYPDNIRDHVSPERLERFFDRSPGGMTVTKHIRQMCVFAVQDVTQDPPFPRIDLVSCRNVLIYLDAAFQKIAIPLFHFALSPGGFLLLGSSESIGQHPELFTAVDQKANLYSKRVAGAKPVYPFPPAASARTRGPGASIQDARAPDADTTRQVDDVLLELYAPPGVLVDGSMRIRQFRGRTSPYLEPASGEASLKLSRMAKEGLALEISLAMDEAKKGGRTVRKEGVSFGAASAGRVDITVVPISDAVAGEPCFLVLFEEPTAPKATTPPAATAGNGEVERLRRDLEATRAHLQAIIEEKDEVNQELWAANEEVQSTNEELQSVNEELEAAKEELESSNEELLALNEELRAKNLDLMEAEAKFRGLIETTVDWIWESDRDGVYTYSSPQVESILGYPPDRIVGRTLFDLMPEEEAERVSRVFQRAAAAGRPIVGLENTNLHRDGRSVVLETNGTPVFDAKGELRGYRGVDRDITERVRADEAARAQEERFGVFFSSVNDAIFVHPLQPEGFAPFIEVNDVACRRYGYSREELLACTARDITTAESMERFGIHHRCRLFDEGRLVFEMEHVKRSGETFPVEISASIIEQDGRRVILSVARDITERKQAEQKLRASEAFLAAVFTSIQDGVSILDAELNIQQVSPVMEQWYAGQMPLVGKKCYRCYQGASRPCDPCPSLRALASGNTEVDVVPGPKGSPVEWIELFSYPLKDPETDATTGVVEFVRDITERRRAEQLLAESEARFRGYVEAAPDGIVVIDEQGRYVDVNEAACRMLGYPRDELLSMPFFAQVHPEDLPAGEQHFADLARTGRASGETRFNRKDGDLRHGMFEAVRLAERRFLCFIRDITESKQVLDQLRHAEKMQAVGQLAGGIAHDFNNQLSGVLGYADILREEAEGNPLLVEYADNIIVAAKRASDLTSQLLAFSRKGKFLNTTVDMHRVVFEAANLLQRSIDKRIVIRQELRANPPTTMGDPTQLQNAVLNLALNARDAMPDGGKLTFATDTAELDEEACRARSLAVAPGRYLQVSVADTGVGIDGQIMERIFEPFFTTKERGRGTGMGLAAVYGTVKSHGGAVTVESQPGRGSTFVLHLPLSSARGLHTAAREPRERPVDGAAHVLLVDDEDIVRRMATTMLESLGYTVTACSDGAEAVEVYRERWRSFDLVILDLVMPVMDGEEAFAAMRRINPDAVVLVSSGYSIDRKAEGIIAQGAAGFIQKPFRTAELSRKVHDALGDRSPPAPSER